MKKLALGVVIALFAVMGAANAQQSSTGIGVYDGKGPYTRMAGKQVVITGSVTNATYAWGFDSRAVQVCLNNRNIATGAGTAVNSVWFRAGTSLTASTGAASADTTGQTIVATSDALFRSGQVGIPTIGDAAPAISSSTSDGTVCMVMPLRARGLIFNASVAATPDVTVFGGSTVSP